MAEQALSSSSIYYAPPTVRVNGQDNQDVTSQVLAMRMCEREGGLCSLELRLGNFDNVGHGIDLVFENERALKLGSELVLYTGDSTAPQEIFRGVVTGFELDFPEKQPPEMLVMAEDKLQLARLARRSKVHEKLKLFDLAGSVASQLGLRPTVTGFRDDIGTQVQLNESDLAFLRRLLARYDGDLQVVGSELQVSPRGDVKRNTVELALYSQLLRLHVTVDLAHQVTATTTAGWDEEKGSAVTHRSTGAHAGPGSGRTGPQLLSQAVGERVEHVSHLAVTTSAEATALADTEFDRRARRFVVVDGTVRGNAKLRVGTHVTLTGVSTRLDNTYYVVSAVHRFDKHSGYMTDFEAESAFLGNP